MDFAQLDPSALLTSDGLIALLTLTVLEIVLGIDNIIVISILSGELQGKAMQRKAQRVGLALAMITRLLLLFSISFIMNLKDPWLVVGTQEFSGRDIVLSAGGLFLIWKATVEIRAKVEHKRERETRHRKATSMLSVVLQIIVIDIVFSLDSVITAVGMSNQLIIMSLAVIISVLIMLLASGTIADFVNKHATVKVLALAFLVVIGVALLMEGFGNEVDKRFIYFAMAFSVTVEFLNLRMRVNAEKLNKGT
ncbi:MAG: TerC family protein [Flavobacteriales bacterium]|nr:TerC family protein [Flavobacteriales bacterium]